MLFSSVSRMYDAVCLSHTKLHNTQLQEPHFSRQKSFWGIGYLKFPPMIHRFFPLFTPRKKKCKERLPKNKTFTTRRNNLLFSGSLDPPPPPIRSLGLEVDR